MNTEIIKNIEKLIGTVKEWNKLDEQGWTSEVYKVTTNTGQYLLKSSVDSRYREWLKTEAGVLEQLNRHDEIPVPTYIGFFEDNNASHLLMSFEPGMTLTTALKLTNDEQQRKALVKSFGEFLHQFHEQNPVGMEFQGNWLEGRLHKAQQYVENGQSDGTLALLQKLKANLPSPVQQTMIHGDCTTDNVLVVNGKVAQFIDVSGMAIGDPRYDEALVIRSFKGKTNLETAFYLGYKRYRLADEEFRYFDDLYEFF